jgi:hypothetical protein
MLGMGGGVAIRINHLARTVAPRSAEVFIRPTAPTWIDQPR